MRKSIIFIALFFPTIVMCQSKDIRLIIAGGPSKHGTGDMPGYSFLNQVDIGLSKRFFLSPGLQFTNNAQRNTLSYFQLNYVTAGVNIFTDINYAVINKAHHKLSIGAGPLIRFQNSSVPTEVASNLNQSGEQMLTLKYDKLHSTSAGYNISPTYYYNCSKKTSVGIKLNLQNDSEGDVINSGLLFVGIKL